MNEDLTIREAYIQASSFLERHASSQDPARVCEWMLLSLLKLSRTEFYLTWDAPFPKRVQETWEAWMTRKAEGEPVQYILGEQEFFGLTFRVNKAVLIPRPETELLVEKLLEIWGSDPQNENRGNPGFSSPEDPQNRKWGSDPLTYPVVADIGTGSGAISVSMAIQRPDWHFHASDISSTALAIAKENAIKHKVSERIAFHQGDLLEPFISAGIAVNILISNPPYIPTSGIHKLQSEVKRFEPILALDGGADGLDFYRKIIKQINELPSVPELIGLEVGEGQAKVVAAMLTETKYWSEVHIIRDLAGIERHVIGSYGK